MKQSLEWFVYVGVVCVLSLVLVQEGGKQVELNAAIPVTGQQLLNMISQSQTKIQILDARPIEGDEGYEETHIPGAVPFPNCDFTAGLEHANKQILSSAPTVIVSADGNSEVFAKCRTQFKVVRNLAGGMKAWIDQGLPEDSGDYTPPRSSSGGGCL